MMHSFQIVILFSIFEFRNGNILLMNSFKNSFYFSVTMPQFLHMAKREAAKPTQWARVSSFLEQLHPICFQVGENKLESFPEQCINYSR